MDKTKFKPISSKPGRFAMLLKNDLEVDHVYQRANINTKLVKNIAENFDWAKFGVVSVSQRVDGTYWVMDSQHRVLAALEREDVTYLPCMVFEMTKATNEAKTFIGINGDRKSVNRLDLHKASVIAGNEFAVKVQKVIDKNGLVLSTGRHRNSIECIAEIERCCKVSFEKFESILPLIVALYDGVTIEREVLAAFFELYRRPGGDAILEPKMKSRIVSTGPVRFRKAIIDKKAIVQSKGAEVGASAVLEIINKGLREKNRLDIDLLTAIRSGATS